MALLPHDIITDILSRLPVKSLFWFKCVSKHWLSKHWLSLIGDRGFAEKHLHRVLEDEGIHQRLFANTVVPSSLGLNNDFEDDLEFFNSFPFYGPDVNIVGSCNGLICIALDLSTFFVLNPGTKECRALPDPGSYPDGVAYYGFGYDASADDYKVLKGHTRVVVKEAGYEHHESIVKVFSLRTNSWRTIQDSSPSYLPYPLPGIFVHGALHWSARHGIEPDYSLIASFDLAAEKFKEVPEPKGEDRQSFFTLGVLRGCLSYVKTYVEGNISAIYMMNKYNVMDSWTKEFRFASPSATALSPELLPLCYTKDGVIAMMNSSKELLLCSPKSQMLNVMEITAGHHNFQMIAYLETLVSPYCSNNNNAQKQEVGDVAGEEAAQDDGVVLEIPGVIAQIDDLALYLPFVVLLD